MVPGTLLWEVVIDNVRSGLSPEQIAVTIHHMGSELTPVRISREAIYQAIYVLPRGALRTETIALLRRGHAKRRPRARGADRRGQIPTLTPIQMRPPEVAERLVAGHWESDTLKGKFNPPPSAPWWNAPPVCPARQDQRTTAEATVDGFSHVLDRVEAQHKLSLTYDRGREMSRHEVLTERTGIKVYFADPRAPWQRGINENTNGLLRQSLPKGEDLSQFSQQDLDPFAWLLNSKPANPPAGSARPNSSWPILIS